MTYYRNLSSSIWFCVFLTLVVATVAESKKNCPKYRSSEYNKLCPGPLRYYELLGCKPVYKYGECCAWRYDCDLLHDVTYMNKCYLNGIEYKIGERRTDVDLCGKACSCERKWDEYADFNCTSQKQFCPPYKPEEGGCNDDEEIKSCPDAYDCQLTRPEGCTKHGKTYPHADFIMSEDKPDFVCVCLKNEGIYGFQCRKVQDWALFHLVSYCKNCAPVHFINPLNTNLVYKRIWRCQEPGDFVISKNCRDIYEPTGERYHSDCVVDREPLDAIHCPHPDHKEYPDSPFKNVGCLHINPLGPPKVKYGLMYRDVCRFGQSVMEVGDYLNSVRFDNRSCIVCLCQVPPVPTCFVWENGVDLHEISDQFPTRIILC